MPGELRDRDGTKGAVVRSLNCLIDPHHSCARHMSPIFPKRKFCEAWSLKQAAWGHGGGAEGGSISVMSYSEVASGMVLGCREMGEQHLS